MHRENQEPGIRGPVPELPALSNILYSADWEDTSPQNPGILGVLGKDGGSPRLKERC